MEMDPFFAVTDSIPAPPPNPKPPSNNTKPSHHLPPKPTPPTNETTPKPTPNPENPSPPTTSPPQDIYPPTPTPPDDHTTDTSSSSTLLEENNQLKDKITRMKNLLARSAKAQREALVDLASTKTKLSESHDIIDRLSARIEILENRPSHLDLLADFETNFDRAVLAMKGEQQQQQQAGGEDPRGMIAAATADGFLLHSEDGDAIAQEHDDAFLTELSECKSRIEHLESLNAAYLHRAAKLEKQCDAVTEERDAGRTKISNLLMELRVAKLETQKATKSAKEKAVALAEMQMEIDLVTKASMNAIANASRSMEEAKCVRTSKVYVEELEAKVRALQEWALASAEAKRLTVERAKDLEVKLHDLTKQYDHERCEEGEEGEEEDGFGNPNERRLWHKASSLVVGAGMVGSFILALGDCKLEENETVQLRWKFDITPGDMDVDFSILKGKWDEKKDRLDRADSLINNRTVVGGAGGELTGAFVVQNACTLVWSNKRSWVRPRAIKFSVEAYAIQ